MISRSKEVSLWAPVETAGLAVLLCGCEPHNEAARDVQDAPLEVSATAPSAISTTSASIDTSQFFPPGYVINLQPDASCMHPVVTPNCTDGFCEVPAGCFIMGAPRDEPKAGVGTDVQVQVTLTHAFELGTYEVTNAEWELEGFAQPLRDDAPGRCRVVDCPISNVNLFEAMTFLNRYSENRGLKPCYELAECTGTLGSGPVCNRLKTDGSGNLECDRTEEDGLNCASLHLTAATPYDCEGYRLPTEAEWEYAGRAGTRTAYWTGPITVSDYDDCVDEPNLSPIAWYCFNGEWRQHAVGEKLPNPWGFYDILGNVSEWTGDAISWNGYGESPKVDPSGYWYELLGAAERNLLPTVASSGEPVRKDAFVTRGGHYRIASGYAKVSLRENFTEIYQGNSAVGFRIARTVPQVP